ncbi:MAG: hypothetical protein ATN36_07795 [Epulopiscium sp. Nele67-Bin005]|nr:MAG: hypothetical protein ATN36_07795 [Epulopiscium sp. Nele67-Bin005]
MSVTFKLEDFEGPLDLLLHLLSKNKMNIYDIEIFLITKQYMQYLDEAKELELESMSEFIVMASTLLLIKSKMLLPKPKKENVEEEDPREELVRKLLEYKKIKYIAQELDERQEENLGYCFRNTEIINMIDVSPLTSEEILKDTTLDLLYEAYETLLHLKKINMDTKEQEISQEILKKDSYTIKEKSTYILNVLQRQGEVTFFNLCRPEMPKMELIVTFMSLLELVHKNRVLLKQENYTKDIIITGVKE